MVATPTRPEAAEIIYPSSDGEPLAETSVHVDAIVNVVVALRQYLQGQRAIVLADQFLYYSQGYPKLRVAPDVMVIENVEPGPRDNYKIWEEGSIPSVIFEITSEGTKDRDEEHKKILYEQLEVREYWQFDPKGEWIPEQLRGYRLRHDRYEPITDDRCQPLNLRLEVEEKSIAFYREDTGEKLLVPEEMTRALETAIQERQEAENRAQEAENRAQEAEDLVELERQRANEAEARAEALAARLKAAGIELD